MSLPLADHDARAPQKLAEADDRSSGRVSSAHAGMTYSPALDGIRAVAILAVLAFHTAPGALSGGFTGVDVFFVLSGFLITSVILHDIRRGRFAFKEFYARRVQRLLPNAVAMTAGTLALLAVALPASVRVSAARHAVWALLNVSNVYIWRNVGGYWGEAAGNVPLLHTWSLAVEEQFYLVFPLLLMLFARGRRTAWWVVALTALSLGLHTVASLMHRVGGFYLLPTRAWEPLMGAALAAYRIPGEGPVRRFAPTRAIEALGWAGLVLVAGSFVFLDEARYAVAGVPLLPSLGTLALLVAAADDETRVAKLLARPSMVAIGLGSYSLYVWHWPLLVAGRMYAHLRQWSEHAGTGAGLAAGVALAVAAYYAVERPLRARGPGRAKRLWFIAATSLASLAASFALSRQRVETDPMHLFERPVYTGIAYNAGAPTRFDRAAAGVRLFDAEVPEGPPRAPDAWRTGGVVHDWGGGAPRVVVFGSSHALMYGAAVDEACRARHVSVAFLAVDGTSPFFPSKSGNAAAFPTPEAEREFDQARLHWLETWRPDAVLVMDRWDHAGRDVQSLAREVDTLADEAGRFARRVVFFSQVPVLRFGEEINLREYVTWYMRSVGHLPTLTPDDHEPTRRAALAMLEDAARRHANVRVLRADQPFYQQDGSVLWHQGRDYLYADDDHVSAAGAARVQGLIGQAIDEATAAGAAR